MQARNLMSTPVVTIGVEATVGEAADIMMERKVSCLPVVSDGGRVVGMLTHTDFLPHRRFLPLANHLYTLLGSWVTSKTIEEIAHEVRSKTVKEVMRSHVVTIREDAPVSEVIEEMLQQDVHRLPVMRGNEIVGITTRHDLLKLMASETWTSQEPENQAPQNEQNA